MFWRFGFHNVSSIDVLLDKEDVTLEEVLEEDELLQEAKNNNHKLVDFICDPNVLRRLIEYITADDVEEQYQFKYPYLACALLSGEMWAVQDALVENRELMDLLWKFLKKPRPLNSLKASYFSKVVGVLVQKKTKETLAYIKEQPNFVETFLRHMTTSAIMDLLLKIISLEELSEGTGTVKGLMEQLVDYMDPNLSAEIHSIAAQVILDIITISQSNNPDQPTIGVNALIEDLKNERMTQKLVDYMLDRDAPNSTSTLVHGVTIYIELIRRNSGQSFGRDQPQNIDMDDLLRVLGSRLGDLKLFLVQPRSAKAPLRTSVGEMVPLGFERLKICELFAELLHCSNISCLYNPLHNFGNDGEKALSKGETSIESIPLESPRATPPSPLEQRHPMENGTVENDAQALPSAASEGMGDACIGENLKKQMLNHQILATCVDLFFEYPWNNFLHTVVYDILHQVLNLPLDFYYNRLLVISVFTECKLTERIVEAQKINEAEERKPRGVRLGYAGHLTFIADEVVRFLELSYEKVESAISRFVESPDWLEYTTKTLREIHERDHQTLGGERPPHTSAQFFMCRNSVEVEEEVVDDDDVLGALEGDTNDQFTRYLHSQLSAEMTNKFSLEEEDDWPGDFNKDQCDEEDFELRASFTASRVGFDLNAEETSIEVDRSQTGATGPDDGLVAERKSISSLGWPEELPEEFYRDGSSDEDVNYQGDLDNGRSSASRPSLFAAPTGTREENPKG